MGVASVSYVACTSPTPLAPDGPVGNLVFPSSNDAAQDVAKDVMGSDDFPVANLAPPPPVDASDDVKNDMNVEDVMGSDDFPVANLVAPPPVDSGAG
jgi:hypothetical protein